MRQGDPLGGPLFALGHYWAFLETIVWTRNYVYPSLVNDTHIVGHVSEIMPTFDHLST